MKPNRRTWITVGLLLLLTEAVYVPASILTGRASLLGFDYLQLHILRMTFARDALLGPRHFLPAWYPHELLGAPFAANLQSFPLIPTRLVLLLLDPQIAYGAGIAIAAALAALFTYLYCRRAGLGNVGAACAGWTFACAGYFACRVTAGHLPLLEAYPSLPLLLWLADRALAPDRLQHQRRDLIALAVASACIALAGHPQVPAYSLLAAVLYVVIRGRGWRRVRIVSAMMLGLGTTLAAWVPMLLLVQRSTRILHLAAPANDIAMPYGRLLSFIQPGVDGWPDVIDLSAKNEFRNYPSDAYFWDTFAYVGLLPLLVMAVLLFYSIQKKRFPRWPWGFVAVLGLGGLLAALPVVEPFRRMIPGTLFRSPARLLYFSTFAASVALGFGVNALLRNDAMNLRAKQVVVACCLVFHFMDLGGTARLFVQTLPRKPSSSPPFETILAREVDSGRVAVAGELRNRYRDRYDDVGIFDSLLLANPYRAILGLAGWPSDLNIQRVDGSDLPAAALRGAGVRFVVTPGERTDLDLVSETDEAYLYRVSDPAPRASFFTAAATDFMPRQKIPDAFVTSSRSDRMLLPLEARAYVGGLHAVYVSDGTSRQNTVAYLRTSSDEIRLDTAVAEPGFAQVLESYDPGWSAEVDGVRAPVVVANGFSMAVPIAPGRHTVRLRYRTPGRAAGWTLSILSGLMFFGLVWKSWGKPV